jgi:hypothetical protein
MKALLIGLGLVGAIGLACGATDETSGSAAPASSGSGAMGGSGGCANPCPSGQYCHPEDGCVPALPGGSPCGAAAECANTLCVDGYCCDSHCDDVCETCALVGSEGVCKPYPSGEDPEDQCGQGSCDGGNHCQPGHVWSKSFGGTGEQFASAIALDATGNAIIAGQFQNTVDFGGGPLTSIGLINVYVAKLDGDGNHLASRGYSGASSASGVATVANDVVVVGMFEGPIDFGGGALVSAGLRDAFVARLDPALDHLWSRRFGDGAEQSALGVAIDASGSVLVAGVFESTIDFGGGALTSAGAEDIFVAKLDNAGNHVWSKRFGGPGAQTAHSIAVADGVVVAGEFVGTVDFGGGPLTAGGRDAFVAKLDVDGNHLWSKQFGDAAEEDGAFGVSIDRAGSIVVGGMHCGPIDLGGGPLMGRCPPNPPSPDLFDAFVAQLDATGDHVWSKTLPDYTFARAVANDSRGNTLCSGGPVFAVKRNVSGGEVWQKTWGSGITAGIVANAADNVFIAGSFDFTINFGGETFMTGGQNDIFVAKLAP